MPYPGVEMPPMPRKVFLLKDLDSCCNNPPCFSCFWRLSKGVKHVYLTPAEIQQISLLQKMYLCNYRINFNPPQPMTHVLLMSGGLEDRHECSLLCSTTSFSSAAFFQQRIYHLCLLGIHRTFPLHVFSYDFFHIPPIRPRDNFFLFPAPQFY